MKFVVRPRGKITDGCELRGERGRPGACPDFPEKENTNENTYFNHISRESGGR